MQTPKRKSSQFTHLELDPYLTPGKFSELKLKLEKMLAQRPKLASEVKRLALDGDFSENAPYQTAKGHLRSLNYRILDLKKHLNSAIIIKPTENESVVQIGSTVEVLLDERRKIFTILGSSETNPTKGIISHNSPIGSALIGQRVGDVIIINAKNKNIKCRVKRIH